MFRSCGNFHSAFKALNYLIPSVLKFKVPLVLLCSPFIKPIERLTGRPKSSLLSCCFEHTSRFDRRLVVRRLGRGKKWKRAGNVGGGEGVKTYDGTQITHRDFQNKGTLTSPARLSFVVKVPLRYLRPCIIYFAQCDRIVQTAYFGWTVSRD